MVKIEVDTKRNTKEDIKKVIEFLQQFLDEDITTNVEEGAFNLFKQDTPLQDTEKPSNDEKESEDIDIKPMFY